MAENQPAGTTVGTLSTTDPDAGDTFAYSLVPGTGSGDNGSFQISGATLQTNAILDFEAKSSYSIRIRTTDQTTRFFEKQFTVTATNLNEAPADIALSTSSVAENQASGTTVGMLSTSPPDAGDTHTYTLVAGTGSTDNASFTISSTSLNTNAVFNFEAKSSYSIRVRTTDGAAQTFEKVFTITVTNVNEAPTDISLSSSSIAENQASGTTVGTLSTTDVDAGSTHTYSLVAGTGSTDNASFSISGTSLNTAAVFNFEAKSSYSIRVRTTDGGSLTFEEVFTISVINVNEAPVNSVPTAQTVNEDTDLIFSSGTGNALGIADVDAGAGNVQTTVSTLNGTITPATGSGATITGSGTSSAQITGTLTQVNAAMSGLRYRGTSNWNSTRGSATLTIATNDQGNTGSGGAQSDSDTVAITVTAVNDAPTATAKSFTAQANMKVVGLTGLLTGASDPDTGDGGYTASLSVGTLSASNPAGATLTLTSASTGTFDFDPPPGTTGAVTFTYTVCDTGNPGPGLCSPATTVTVNIAGPVIWFVNAAVAAGGDGRLSSPFNTLAAADVVDAANHSIFLYSGTYTTGITLNPGEKLIGQGTTGSATFDLLFGITPPTGTIARPAVATGTATVQGTVTLASTNTLRGLALSTGASTGLTGSGGLTAIDVAQTSVTTTTGTAVTLNNAAGTYSFSNISTNGAANGILLDTLGTSTFTATGGSIVGATTGGVDINGGSGNFTYSGTISTSGTGRSVEITNRTGGTTTFSGAVADAGTGISLSSNTGATINFTGGITASTGANAAFSATGGGTVSVTGAANTLTTTMGTALNIASTTIGASGLTFRSVSANGAASGIVLNNTGASGSLVVTGNGGSCSSVATCTGGAIQNTTSYGISMTNTLSPSFTRMALQNIARNGVDGQQVTNFTFANGFVSNTGTGGLGQYEENAIAFVDRAGFEDSTVSGNVSITGNTINQPRRNGITIETWAGTISNLTITGNTLTGGTTTSNIADAIHVFPQGSATTNAHLTTGSISSNTISGFRFLSGSIFIGGNGIRLAGGAGSATNLTPQVLGTSGQPITITGNSISGVGSNGIAVSFNGQAGSSYVNVTSNGTAGSPMTNMEGLGISVFFGADDFTGSSTIDNNFVGTVGPTVHAGSSGIGVQLDTGPSGATSANPAGNFSVTNNSVAQPDGSGFVAIGINNAGVMDVDMRNNTVGADPFLANRSAIRIAQNNATSPTICLQLSGNSTTGGSGVNQGLGIRRNTGLTFGVVGLPAGSTASPAFEAYINGQNPSGGGTDLISQTTGFSSCTLTP